MSSTDPNLYPNPKFTRGEKCIFTHLIITFVGIIIVIVIYFGHVAIVRHLGDDIYRITRRSHQSVELMKEEVVLREANAEPAGCVGAAYVLSGESKEARAACSVALLTAQWSLATAHCVSVRALPELAHLLPHWTVRYQEHSTGVHRGAVHPSYHADDLANNVGLFEHAVDISKTVPTCTIPTEKIYASLRTEEKSFSIVGWQAEGGGRSLRRVYPMPMDLCSQFVTPVVDTMRGDELCFSDDEDNTLDKPLPGAVVFVNSHMIGIFSWGDSQDKSFPYVIIDIEPFKHWLETTMSLG